MIRRAESDVFISVTQFSGMVGGQHMSDEFHVITVDAFLRALERAQRAYLLSGVASELASKRGRVVSSNELLEAVYGCSAREPEEAAIALKVAIYKLRKTGFNIVTHPWRGYSHHPS
jgi:DNA-binding winged helix-turn-helix (wHTH) protein